MAAKGTGSSGRKVRDVSHRPDNTWQVRQRGSQRAEGVSRTKEDAVKKATTRARQEHEEKGQLGQVVIRKQDGTIQEERTYGKDPHPPKG